MSNTVSSTSSYSTKSRITGMVSGIDVDTTVKQLMDAEEEPLNKLKQKKQLAEWKQDDYREVSNSLRAFNDKYFSYSTSSTNMLSSSTYKQYTVTSSEESSVTASTNSEVKAGTHTIVVNNLATAASYKSSAGVTKNITGSAVPDFVSAKGKSFVLDIDGTKSTITIDETVTDIDTLQAAIDKAVGSGKINVSDSNGDGTGYLTLSKVEDSGIGKITLSDGESRGAVASLGFTSDSNLSNYLDTTDTLETISKNLKNSFTFDSAGNVNFTINNVNFEFSKSTTLKDMMKKINSSDAGVTMEYSTTNDSFSIVANNTGAGNKINITESGSTFLQNAGITNYTAGEDAIATIDGVKVTRSSNTITQDGVIYTLKEESTEKQTVSVAQDTQGIYDKIKSFVDDYNSLINTLNDKISEEYDRDYSPLTDDQKDEMSDDEIESWEKKAKTGLLEDDSTIQDLLRNMRSALYESVSGVSKNLTEIGITTSSNYEDKGKLEIDENTLKQAIEANPEDVVDLFSKQSETYSGTAKVRNLTSKQREVRSSEEGLAYKLYDILQDSISTYTNSNGKKGSLIEKAGLEGDGSEDSNSLSKQIDDYQEDIDAMVDQLEDKEDAYYEKYSTMETYINQMNNQLTSLQSYLE